MSKASTDDIHRHCYPELIFVQRLICDDSFTENLSGYNCVTDKVLAIDSLPLATNNVNVFPASLIAFSVLQLRKHMYGF